MQARPSSTGHGHLGYWCGRGIPLRGWVGLKAGQKAVCWDPTEGPAKCPLLGLAVDMRGRPEAVGTFRHSPTSQHHSLPQRLVCSVLPVLSLALPSQGERAARSRSCWRHDVTIRCCPLATLCTVGQSQALTSWPRRKKVRGWVLHPRATLSETMVGCRPEDH